MPDVLRDLQYRYTDTDSRVNCSKVLSTVTYKAFLDSCTHELKIRLVNSGGMGDVPSCRLTILYVARSLGVGSVCMLLSCHFILFYFFVCVCVCVSYDIVCGFWPLQPVCY